MIITDKFVMINFPKTGSTFVRNTLKKIHSDYSAQEKIMFKLGIKKKPYFENLWLPNIRTISFRKNKNDEHGIASQIPEKHRKKKIVSIKRDVFERYISAYEYGDWKVAPWMEINDIKKKFPSYPNLTFSEYVHFLNENNPLEKHPRINKKLFIGAMSSQFLLFFSKKPFNVLSNFETESNFSTELVDHLHSVHFLKQSNLNNELYEFLLEQGYSKHKISFIKEAEKSNVSSKKKCFDEYYDSSLKEYILEKENILFSIMENYV